MKYETYRMVDRTDGEYREYFYTSLESAVRQAKEFMTEFDVRPEDLSIYKITHNESGIMYKQDKIF